MASDEDLRFPPEHQFESLPASGIEKGESKPNQPLPSAADLVESLRVGKLTVRQALRELSQAGYIRREPGLDTFVSLQRSTRGLTSFTEDMQSRDMVATSRVLGSGITDPPAKAAKALQLKSGEKVFVLRRLRMANNEPVGLQTAYLPASLVPGLEMESLDGSLYSILESRYGLSAAKAQESHFAALVGSDDAGLLQVDPGCAGLAAERVTFLADGRPLEMALSLMRGDRYRISLEIAPDR